MLTWIEPNQPLPPPESALTEPAGLVAAGRDLSAKRLLEAYSQGIFPWYSEGQPVLWWSPDPRMVVFIDEFEPSRSLRKTLRRIGLTSNWSVTLDQAFVQVMQGCAAPRSGQDGTWITRDIIKAYHALHQAGNAHSVEVWSQGQLVGGLYGVSIGRMFFGESMFARVSEASKCAYAALIAMLRRLGFSMVDCQQSTGHLASLGAREISRREFLAQVRRMTALPGPQWREVSIDWPPNTVN
ncbi:MAG: leucyl/phenylalanyl-tRNA--protein transferase [Lautropia sp.]|nr:leucyl/phenylalanyl-tRNA--protein transferase [Lautropia sp.]